MQKSGGRRKKQVSLYSQEGADISAMTLPGRRLCNCQATKHDLVTNCLSCGRIVCQQEGPGPCLFCGTQVGEGEKASGSQSEALNKAILHKNKILNRDRHGEHSRVIDDERDYFRPAGVAWLNPRQRKALQQYQEQMETAKQRRQKTYTIDFAGRQVTTDAAEPPPAVDVDRLTSLLAALGDTDAQSCSAAAGPTATTDGAGPQQQRPRPQYVPDARRAADPDQLLRAPAAAAGAGQPRRVQDAGLQQLADAGHCLSMHQPYASLLTAGIKVHEGRAWYTPHRGPLWIAAAARQPTADEIDQLQRFYRLRSGAGGGGEPAFPQHYPAGCLLGRVVVQDCLPQEVYRAQYPDGESDSPYVLICSQPEQLIVKFPMKGQHKIYKLDPTIHQAAKKMLAAN